MTKKEIYDKALLDYFKGQTWGVCEACPWGPESKDCETCEFSVKVLDKARLEYYKEIGKA